MVENEKPPIDDQEALEQGPRLEDVEREDMAPAETLLQNRAALEGILESEAKAAARTDAEIGKVIDPGADADLAARRESLGAERKKIAAEARSEADLLVSQMVDEGLKTGETQEVDEWARLRQEAAEREKAEAAPAAGPEKKRSVAEMRALIKGVRESRAQFTALEAQLKKDPKNLDVRMRFEAAKESYEALRAEYVGDNALRLGKERLAIESSRVQQVVENRSGWDKMKKWVYDAYKTMGDMNAHDKWGWKFSDKTRMGRLGNKVTKALSVRTAIGAVLGLGGAALGMTSAVGIGAVALRRGIAGLGAGIGSYDAMRQIADRGMERYTKENVKDLTPQELVEGLEALEAKARVAGDPKMIEGNAAYTALRREYRSRFGDVANPEMAALAQMDAGKKKEAMANLMGQADASIEAAVKRRGKNDFRMKVGAIAVGAFVGSGYLAKMFGGVTKLGLEKAGLVYSDPAAMPERYGDAEFAKTDVVAEGPAAEVTGADTGTDTAAAATDEAGAGSVVGAAKEAGKAAVVAEGLDVAKKGEGFAKVLARQVEADPAKYGYDATKDGDVVKWAKKAASKAVREGGLEGKGLRSGAKATLGPDLKVSVSEGGAYVRPPKMTPEQVAAASREIVDQARSAAGLAPDGGPSGIELKAEDFPTPPRAEAGLGIPENPYADSGVTPRAEAGLGIPENPYREPGTVDIRRDIDLGPKLGIPAGTEQDVSGGRPGMRAPSEAGSAPLRGPDLRTVRADHVPQEPSMKDRQIIPPNQGGGYQAEYGAAREDGPRDAGKLSGRDLPERGGLDATLRSVGTEETSDTPNDIKGFRSAQAGETPVARAHDPMREGYSAETRPPVEVPKVPSGGTGALEMRETTYRGASEASEYRAEPTVVESPAVAQPNQPFGGEPFRSVDRSRMYAASQGIVEGRGIAVDRPTSGFENAATVGPDGLVTGYDLKKEFVIDRGLKGAFKYDLSGRVIGLETSGNMDFRRAASSLSSDWQEKMDKNMLKSSEEYRVGVIKGETRLPSDLVSAENKAVMRGFESKVVAVGEKEAALGKMDDDPILRRSEEAKLLRGQIAAEKRAINAQYGEVYKGAGGAAPAPKDGPVRAFFRGLGDRARNAGRMLRRQVIENNKDLSDTSERRGKQR